MKSRQAGNLDCPRVAGIGDRMSDMKLLLRAGEETFQHGDGAGLRRELGEGQLEGADESNADVRALRTL